MVTLGYICNGVRAAWINLKHVNSGPRKSLSAVFWSLVLLVVPVSQQVQMQTDIPQVWAAYAHCMPQFSFCLKFWVTDL